MTRALKILALVLLACLLQTNLARAVRVMGVAPDFMIAMLAALAWHLGTYGGFCAGALMGLLYDASVGYVLALNLVSYTGAGYFCPFIRQRFSGARKQWTRRLLLLLGTAFGMTMAKEIIDVGYLFLIGAEVGLSSIVRAVLCASLTAAASLPALFLADRLFPPAKKGAARSPAGSA